MTVFSGRQSLAVQPFIAAQADRQGFPVIAEPAVLQAEQSGASQLYSPGFTQPGIRQQPDRYGKTQPCIAAVTQINPHQNQQVSMDLTTG